MKSLICLFVLLGVCSVFGGAVEQWGGLPADCAPWLSGEMVAVAVAGSQPVIAAQITPGIAALNQTGPSCRKMGISALCKLAFPVVNTTSGTVMYACRSNCDLTLQYCLQTFILFSGGVSKPFNTCADPLTGWAPNSPTCNPPFPNAGVMDPEWEVEPFSLTQTFRNNPTLQATYKKVYDYCTPYITGQIFVSDQAPQRVLAAIVLPKLLALEAAKNVSLPWACFDATVELICKTAYPLGITITAGTIVPGVFPPIDFLLPLPPCDNVCTIQNNQCVEAFYIGNVLDQLVNCSGPSSFPGFPQYPKGGWTLPPFGTLPCTPAANLKPSPTFHCEAYDPQISGKTCAQYIDYPIWIPPVSTPAIAALGTKPSQVVLGRAASPLLKASKALPDYCRQNQEELICKSIFQSCYISKFNISTRNPPVAFNFTYGGAPCKPVCTAQNQQCAQILSLTGNEDSIPDCGATSNGLPSYPTTGYDFQNGLFVPCSPSIVPPQPKPFNCEDFQGKPDVCKPYLNYKIMTTPDFDQKYLAKQVSKALEGTDALPDSCKESLYELACRTGFRKCKEEKAGGVEFDFGTRPCLSQCDQVVKQCGGLFVLAGQSSNIPDCSERDTTDGQPSYPKSSLKYSAFGDEFKLPCVPSDVKPKTVPVRCEKLQNGADFCKKYVADTIFASDPIPQDVAIQVTSQFNELLREAPDSCKEYALNLACNVMFQGCEEKTEDGFTAVLVSPPCKSVCTQMPKSCKKYFDFYGIPIPDCNEKDPITNLPRYTNSWQFHLGKKTYTQKCRMGTMAPSK